MPKRDTQTFLKELRDLNWYPEGYRVLSDGEKSLIPISDSAPTDLPTSYIIVDRHQDPPAAKSWLSLLPKFLSEEIIEKHLGTWPNSHELYSDLLIFKIEQHIEQYAQQVALAKIHHSNKIRVVMLDEGVIGEYRIRNLKPLAARFGERIIDVEGILNLPEETRKTLISSNVKIRENGTSLLLNPAIAYYSSRLAGEREKTVESATQLKEKLGRPISVADPYCGVGPAVVQLLAQQELVGDLLATDINPEAIKMLKINLGEIKESWYCKIADALKLNKNQKLLGRFDLLLMNLPHSTLQHLPKLLPLLKTNTPTLLKGWYVVEEEEISSSEGKFTNIIHETHTFNGTFKLEIRRQYNATKVLTRFECRLGEW
ncbi:hypothetical protein OAJ94_02385 [Deltaproteobacteria bacterium]|nr:hypothetical protein [Deltaproteobacteria bacterium]